MSFGRICRLEKRMDEKARQMQEKARQMQEKARRLERMADRLEERTTSGKLGIPP